MLDTATLFELPPIVQEPGQQSLTWDERDAKATAERKRIRRAGLIPVEYCPTCGADADGHCHEAGHATVWEGESPICSPIQDREDAAIDHAIARAKDGAL